MIYPSPMPRKTGVHLAVIAALGASLTGCSAVAHITGLDCINDPADGDWGKRVQRETVLYQPPAGATPANSDGVYVSPVCSDDNAIAEIGRLYRFTGSPLAVADHYKQTAQQAGWHLTEDGTKDFVHRAGSTEQWPSDSCFSKNLGDFTADLELGFDYWSADVEENPSIKQYWIEISFSPTGGNCQSIPRAKRVWPG